MAGEILRDVPAQHESDSGPRSGVSYAVGRAGAGRRKTLQFRGGPNLRTDRLRSALPAPVETEALTVPAEDGLRLDQDESLAPSGPDPGQPDPQNAVGIPKPNRLPGVLALQDEELMAKSGHLGM